MIKKQCGKLSSWSKSYTIDLLSRLLIEKISLFWRLPLLFASVYLFIALIFAIFYSISGESFFVYGKSSDLDFLTSIYYSMVTITTLGYGDIFPKSGFVRFLAGTEAFLGVLTIGAVLAVFGLQLSKRQHRVEAERVKAEEAYRLGDAYYKMAVHIHRFLESHDQNRAPPHLTGGMYYYFSTGNSILYRNIDFPGNEFYQQLLEFVKSGDADRVKTNYGGLLRDYGEGLRRQLDRCRSLLNDHQLLDDIEVEIDSALQKSDYIIKRKFDCDKEKEFADDIGGNFVLALNGAHNTLTEILNRHIWVSPAGKSSMFHYPPKLKELTKWEEFKKSLRKYVDL